MRVALFRDYQEENWHSMEVYADALGTHLRRLRVGIDVRNFVTLPQFSRLFPSSYKYMRQFFRYVVNPLGALFFQSDIYHITDHANAHLIAVLDSSRTIVTCHDLTAPYWMEKHVRLTLKKRIRHAVEKWRLGFMRRAAVIIAVSQATKADIVKTLGIPGERIVVIPEGVDAIFQPIRNNKKLRETERRPSLPRRYLLHVGTTYTNKNIEGLLHAFFSLAKDDKTLVLVKAGDPWTDEQQRLVNESEFASRVIHLGFADEKDLPVLYSRAIALLQPSYAEGFGFTVLEAMSCGCPVIVSDIPALREMAGEAGIYIRPDPTPADFRAMRAVIRSTPVRKRLSRAGRIRARRYTWKKAAQQTYAAYVRVLTGRKGAA